MKFIARAMWLFFIMIAFAGTFDGDPDPRLPHPHTEWGIFLLTIAGLLVFSLIITAMIDAYNDRRFGRNIVESKRASRALTKQQ
jgi:hypothetical protein